MWIWATDRVEVSMLAIIMATNEIPACPNLIRNKTIVRFKHREASVLYRWKFSIGRSCLPVQGDGIFFAVDGSAISASCSDPAIE